MQDDDQKTTDEEAQRPEDELWWPSDIDDAEISDEELQRLIDVNDADSAEPGGISPNRREKLLKDTEDRIATLATIFKPGDCILQYFEDRRAALLRGDSADQIDALTEEYAERNDVDLDALDEDWVGTTRLKLKKINRIEDEAEREAAIYALARESVLRDEQQAAIRPEQRFTDEWYAEQRRGYRRRRLIFFLQRLIDSLKHPLHWIGGLLAVVGLIAGGIIVAAFDYRWFAVVTGLFVIYGAIYLSERFRRMYEKKEKETRERLMSARPPGPKDTSGKNTI